MKNTRQPIHILTRSIAAGAGLWLFTTSAQAGPPPTGSITFSPASMESVPALGSAMLILLSLLLAFIAFVSFRRRQRGMLPVVAGALALASLVSAGGGASLLHKAIAGDTATIINPAGETKVIYGDVFNSYINGSGVTLRIGPATLPPGCPSSALTDPGACVIGSNLANGDECTVDCGAIEVSDARLKTDIVLIGQTDSGLPWYQFRYKGNPSLYEGVMAQDVLKHTPAAVHVMSNGYMAVDYAMLGLSMRAVN